MHFKKDAHKRFIYRNEKWAYLMLIPGFILMTTFVVIPLIMAVYRSFFNYSTYETHDEFVGFENYKLIFSTEYFGMSIRNACMLTIIISLGVVVLGFLFASVLKALNSKLSSFAKIIIYIPYLMSGIAASIMFSFLFNYSSGLFNSLRIEAGKAPIAFQVDGIWPYILVILPTIWLTFGYNTLVFYAGLQGIPKSYYEAADMDGATAWQKIRYITIPNLKNYFVLIIVGLVSGNLQMFEVPFMMTGGGPLNKTLTPVLYLYNLYRSPTKNPSVTIAGAIILMIPIALINGLIFVAIRSERSQDE